MRFIDLISLIVDNLGRRKGRVALTAIGVVIGTAAVVILVSLAIGLQQNATSQLYGIGDLTVIQVYPGQGEMLTEKAGGGGGGGGCDLGLGLLREGGGGDGEGRGKNEGPGGVSEQGLHGGSSIGACREIARWIARECSVRWVCARGAERSRRGCFRTKP